MTEPPHVDDVTSDEDEDRRRRLLFFWLFFSAGLVVVIVVFLLSGGDDDPTAGTTTLTSTVTAVEDTAPVESTVPAVTSTHPSETTTTTEAATIDGVWTMNIDVTIATGACEGEEEEEVTPDTVTIRQSGDRFEIVGLGFPKDEQVWEGRIEGNVVTFGGERTEDEGTTTVTFNMEVDFDTFTMTGREDWTWEGPGGTCPNSESIVKAVRVNP